MNSDAASILAFGLLSLLVLWISWKRGFFVFPEGEWIVPIRFLHVIGAFAIYFFGSLIASSIFTTLLKLRTSKEQLGLSSWFNFLTSAVIFLALILFWRICSEPLRKGIWRRTNGTGHLYAEDICFAFLAWFISFPLVLFLNQLLEWLVSYFFHLTQLPDQLAVYFLKMTFGQPVFFVLAITSIVIFAPVLEELLFRGFLQTYIRQHLGSKQAILITSVCFAFFHYSGDQGLGNIPIIASLFLLALFLGFLYERQGSLLAPITLHASFNAISIINLYFLGEFPGAI